MEAQDSSKVLDKVRVLNGVLLKVEFFFCFMIVKYWTIWSVKIGQSKWWVSIVVSTQGFQPCREGFKSPTHYKASLFKGFSVLALDIRVNPQLSEKIKTDLRSTIRSGLNSLLVQRFNMPHCQCGDGGFNSLIDCPVYILVKSYLKS